MDPLDRAEQLVLGPAHRSSCTFGSGFFRVQLSDGTARYCQDTAEVERVHRLLPWGAITSVQRDGYCLDGDRQGDAHTSDVVDGEQWLALPQDEAMALVGLDDARQYARVYRQIEQAVGRRNNREAQTGVHASIVIKKRGARVVDVPLGRR